MNSRKKLQAKLESLMDGHKVYFQPPETVKLTYPCIIFSLSSRKTIHADNSPYGFGNRYSVTIIDQNPDSVFADKVAMLPTARFNRSYTADNLHHTVYTLYF